MPQDFLCTEEDPALRGQYGVGNWSVLVQKLLKEGFDEDRHGDGDWIHVPPRNIKRPTGMAGLGFHHLGYNEISRDFADSRSPKLLILGHFFNPRKTMTQHLDTPTSWGHPFLPAQPIGVAFSANHLGECHFFRPSRNHYKEVIRQTFSPQPTRPCRDSRRSRVVHDPNCHENSNLVLRTALEHPLLTVGEIKNALSLYQQERTSLPGNQAA